ncbi:MAG: prolipoprotein diacylglyceryl transferase [Candidatus Hydrogenedentes bacterium]|nr:prolipoprotein diacylglyceryl transferase [Candidatus Hydrogenedentota bacterium]
MYPTILELGPITLYSYGLMIALGFITILYFMQRDAKRVDVEPQAIADMAFWSLLIGVASSRFFHIIMYSEHYSWGDPFGWIDVRRGGLVFQGAVPTVVLYVAWSLRRRKLSFRTVADVVMPYVSVAQAFGRVSCFLKGCCHGSRADELFWGVRFPQESPAFATHQRHYPNFPADATLSYPVHPTQLYSVALLLGICGLLLLLRSKRPFEGATFPAYFALYGICRFIVEIFRGDGNPTNTWLGIDFTTQQLFCLGMIAFAIVAWIIMKATRDKNADPTFPTPG